MKLYTPSPITPLPAAAIPLLPAAAAVEAEPAPGPYPGVAPAGRPVPVRARAIAPPGVGPLLGAVRWRRALAPRWQEEPLEALGDGRFAGTWTPPVPGEYEWTVEVWPDGDDERRAGSSGAGALHLLRAERPEVDTPWWPAPRLPLLDLVDLAPDTGVVLLPPIFAGAEGGAVGRDGVGHYTIDPALGGVGEFGELAASLRTRGIDLAMTFPLRCSPDHPLRRRDPEGFDDGGIPDLLAAGWHHRWEAWEAVFRFWLVGGIDLFFIPDAEMLPLSFWGHLTESLRRDFPEAAFTFSPDTDPAAMGHLLGAGLSPLAGAPAPGRATATEDTAATPGTAVTCSCTNPDIRASLTVREDGAAVLHLENAGRARAASGHIHIDGAALGLSEHERYYLRDPADDRAYRWSGTTNFINLEGGDTKTFHIERS